MLGERFLELAREFGAVPRKSGKDWRCACPLHADSGPGLFVLTPITGLWHCMSQCGGGDAIALVMRARSLDFGPALDWLAEWAGFRSDGPAVVPERRERPRAVRPTAPAPTPASDDAGAFLAKLWDCVAEAPWGSAVTAWLMDVRGIEPDAAYALGCRDWSTCRDDLAELVRQASPEVLEVVGMARDERLHSALLGCLRGDATWDAVAVPVWRLGCAFPERWRWRLVTPRAVGTGGTVKSWAPYKSGLPLDLLGVGRPDRIDAPEVGLAWLGAGGEGAGLVLLVEGEPDWWAATEAVDGRAVVLAVCGGPSKWHDEWPTMDALAALGVRRVAVCVHHGERAKDGRGHGEHFADAVAVRCLAASVAYRRKLPAEGQDLNDLHRAGALRAWLADVLEVDNGQ